MKQISLCVLAYKRPQLLERCLASIRESSDYPHSVIVNLDGDDSGNSEFLFGLYKRKLISQLSLNAGLNRGVGRSFANCVGLAEGEVIVKVDTDLTFSRGWMSQVVKILDNNQDVGAVSLFNYRHYDPKDERFNVLSEREDCLVVDDIVSSVYAFRKEDLFLGGYDYDDGFHTRLKSHRGALALTKTDMCKNDGFGVGKSVYISGTEEAPFKTPTHSDPLIFNSGLAD